MSFKDKRDLWYVSGNKHGGDVFAIPVTEVEDGAEILTDDIARLRDSDVDGARRWCVVAQDGQQAVDKVVNYVSTHPEAQHERRI